MQKILVICKLKRASILQCLCHSRKLIEDIKGIDSSLITKDKVILQGFLKFIYLLFNESETEIRSSYSNNSFISPRTFKRIFTSVKNKQKNELFKGSFQQDAFEFLSSFLDLLHEELATKKEKNSFELQEHKDLKIMVN